eukprot:3799429-Rhodomonas_salina.3
MPWVNQSMASGKFFAENAAFPFALSSSALISIGYRTLCKNRLPSESCVLMSNLNLGAENVSISTCKSAGHAHQTPLQQPRAT